MNVIIIGAGPAGVTVAETVRQHDATADILLLSSEPFPPYAPPAMIEYFMSGQEAHLWRWKELPDRLGLDYRPGTIVNGVSPEQHEIHLEGDETLHYDSLVIASGSRLYAPLPGADKPGVYNFKSLSAACKLMGKVHEGQAKKAIIVGAGFIGMEIAVLLRSLGIKVTLVEMADRVMSQMLDRETSELTLGMMHERGVNVRLNTTATAFLGDSAIEAVELESGEILDADLFVAATGVKPNMEFLAGSGIRTDTGVQVDDHLRTTVPDVYAAGDVAQTAGRISGERSLYPIFPNAVAQGRVAAYNLLGWDVPYEGAERMNSLKHLGIPVIVAGRMSGEETCARRRGSVRKIYLKEGRIMGFQLVGDIRAAGIYRTLMNKGINIESLRDHLLEPGFGMGYIPDQSLLWSQRMMTMP